MVRPGGGWGGGVLLVLRGPVDQCWTSTSFKPDHGVALNKLWVHLG